MYCVFALSHVHVQKSTTSVAEGPSRALRWGRWSWLEPAMTSMGQPRPLLTEHQAALPPHTTVGAEATPLLLFKDIYHKHLPLGSGVALAIPKSGTLWHRRLFLTTPSLSALPAKETSWIPTSNPSSILTGFLLW